MHLARYLHEEDARTRPVNSSHYILSHFAMQSRTEQTEMELASVSVETKKFVSFTIESNASCSAALPRDRAASTGPVLGEMPKFSVNTWLRTEIVVLSFMVVVVWILLSLPLIFYHLPEETKDEPGSGEMGMIGPTVSPGSGEMGMIGPTVTCDSYTGDVCRDVLQSQQSCLPDGLGSSEIHISPRDGDNQEELEIQAQLLLNGLSSPLISASPECEEAVLPFLCLYLFSLCDSDGTLYQPSSMDCVTISTVVCAREWIIATMLLGQERLPQCESLPMTSLLCENVTENITSDSAADSNNTTCSRECRDGFYKNDTLCACLPRCDTWEQYPHSTTVASDFFVVLSATVGLIAGIAVLVISCIRWKRIFVFPSVFTVYMTIALIIVASVVLISYTDRSKLFCSSMFLQQSLQNATSFCIFAGIVFYYILLQLALWWFFHVLSLFWKIKFPLHAKTAESAHLIRYVHLAMVVLGLILPLVPVIASLATTGFGLNRFPAILCGGRSANASFYALVLPIMLLLQVGITLLVVIFWTIHKQQGLFRMRQSRSPLQMETAEKKILIIFCYYVILGVIALTTFTLGTKNGQRVAEEIGLYFTCESLGTETNCDSERSSYQALLYPALNCLSYVLLGIFPAINLIFAVNATELKQWCGRARRFHLPSISGELSSTASASTAVSVLKRNDSIVAPPA